MTTTIVEARPDSPEARALIEELDAHLNPLYPSESRHGYSVDKLIQQGVVFFVVHHAGNAAGCGGVQLVGTTYGELKRMYIRPEFRGLGLGKALLRHMTAYAQHHQVSLLRLETGIYQKEAISLYEKWGFARIPPFGEYKADPLSIFYEKRIL